MVSFSVSGQELPLLFREGYTESLEKKVFVSLEPWIVVSKAGHELHLLTSRILLLGIWRI